MSAPHPRPRAGSRRGRALLVTVSAAALLLAAACSASGGSAGPMPDGELAKPPKAAASLVVDDAKNSYELTSSQIKVEKLDHTVKQTASCGDGFYVRPGPPDETSMGTGILPYVKLGGNKDWVSVSASGFDRYGNGNNWSPFKSMHVTLTNRSLDHDHTVTFSWWCDAVPPWVTKTSATKQPKGTRPGVDPIPPPCYFCDENLTSLTSDGPGNPGALAQGGGSAVVTGQPHSWNYVHQGFSGQLPTYSIWFGSQGENKAVLAEDTGSHLISLQQSNGGVPKGGNWFYLSEVTGPTASSVMYANTDTDQCLAAGADSGDQVQTRTCNTWDTAQWWAERT